MDEVTVVELLYTAPLRDTSTVPTISSASTASKASAPRGYEDGDMESSGVQTLT